MLNSQIFKIGAVNIAIVTKSPDCDFQSIRGFLQFRSDERPDVILNVYCDHMPDLYLDQPMFDSGTSWRLYKNGNKRVLWLRSPELNPHQIGIFTPDFLSGDIYVLPSPASSKKHLFPLQYPMGELFITNLLSQGYGLCMHAAGVIDKGGGMVFAGKSGAGKSTTAGLWEGQEDVKVVNDDRVIIRKIDGQFWMYGTPWHGEGGMALPDGAPLEKVFLLKHARENYVLPLDPVTAAAALLVRTYAPHWDKCGMEFTLSFLGDLSQTVHCYELGFVPDFTVVNFVRDI
jgi:hypothetical protein